MAVLVLVSARVAAGHPFHVSIAEAEFNGKTGKLEVALRVHPGDLEEALHRRSHQKVDLEKTDNVDRFITVYLRERFVVSNKRDEPFPLQWVGKEVSVKYAWLYFEIPIPQSTQELVVSNRVLFELVKYQINTVTFRQQERRLSIRFTREQATQKLALPLTRSTTHSREQTGNKG